MVYSSCRFLSEHTYDTTTDIRQDTHYKLGRGLFQEFVIGGGGGSGAR